MGEPNHVSSVTSRMNHNVLQQITNLSPIAYLDGGSGSLIFQIVIASSLTGIYAAKTRWATIVAAVKKFQNKDSKPSSQ